ncbi:acyl-CoA thioesterase [Aquimarina intermedia]|uniref:Acyl-CoA thioester hydrolase n=1 Tax=Aquimarina intermedia TaxID=350814 RepID=A0A5S5C1I1_9FLAO|nr:thioesterase family protein [Aquimarina intermedia]TYP72286.1 acyl-CoA thioester hydrolase [Aquimarina intermedia]
MSISSKSTLKVRYSETDQMGVVHHSNYAKYLEIARIDWISQLGFSYKSMEDDGVMLPVFTLAFKFKKSAFFDDVLTVKTILKKIPTFRIQFEYQIYNQKEELLTTASTDLVFVDAKTRKPMLCPQPILDKISELF